MNKIKILFVAIISTVYFVSCGPSKEEKQQKALEELNKAFSELETEETKEKPEVKKEPEKTISSENFKVFNNAKPYFKVADGEYTPYVKNKLNYIDVTFELLKTYDKKVPHEQAFVELVPQNEKGGKVKHQSHINFRPDDSDGSMFYNFLMSEPGEKITMTFSSGQEGSLFPGDAVKAKELNDDLAKFQVKLELN